MVSIQYYKDTVVISFYCLADGASQWHCVLLDVALSTRTFILIPCSLTKCSSDLTSGYYHGFQSPQIFDPSKFKCFRSL